MCDYSLMGVPNRLATEDEELIIHRFCTGSLGLASPSDLIGIADPPAARQTFWASVKGIFGAPRPRNTVTAVCIPPGAKLMLQGISGKSGWAGEVTFTQLTAEEDTYRDAFRFKDGTEVCLQLLREGQRVRVLQLCSANEPVYSPIAVHLRETPDRMARRWRLR